MKFLSCCLSSRQLAYAVYFQLISIRIVLRLKCVFSSFRFPLMSVAAPIVSSLTTICLVCIRVAAAVVTVQFRSIQLASQSFDSVFLPLHDVSATFNFAGTVQHFFFCFRVQTFPLMLRLAPAGSASTFPPSVIFSFRAIFMSCACNVTSRGNILFRQHSTYRCTPFAMHRSSLPSSCPMKFAIFPTMHSNRHVALVGFLVVGYFDPSCIDALVKIPPPVVFLRGSSPYCRLQLHLCLLCPRPRQCILSLPSSSLCTFGYCSLNVSTPGTSCSCTSSSLRSHS
eukprot:gene7612-15594_t